MVPLFRLMQAYCMHCLYMGTFCRINQTIAALWMGFYPIRSAQSFVLFRWGVGDGLASVQVKRCGKGWQDRSSWTAVTVMGIWGWKKPENCSCRQMWWAKDFLFTSDQYSYWVEGHKGGNSGSRSLCCINHIREGCRKATHTTAVLSCN